MPRVPAGDISIHYDIRGEGEPLLLINGFGSSSATWRPEFLDGLARSFRLIAFDNRGTGQTDQPDAPYSLAMMADDAAGLLDALGIGRAHVMGLSMGGMIAQELALRHPEKIAGLVLGCTNCGGRASVQAGEETLNLLMIPEGMDPHEAARRAWPASYTPEFIAANRDLLEEAFARAIVHPTPLYARTRQMEAIRAWGTFDRLDQITAPTLVVTGDRDALVPPRNSEILRERIGGSRLVTIAGAAHNFASSHPAEAVGAITEFFQTVDAARLAGAGDA